MFNSAPYLIILAALLWSLDGFLRRHLYSLPAGVIVFLEHLLGLVVLTPFLVREFKSWAKLNTKTWLSVVAIALFSSTLATIAYTSALGRINYISLSVVVLLQQLQPVFAIALAGLLLREKITSKFVALAILALGAAYFVSFPNLQPNLETGAGTVTAALLAVFAAFAWGGGTVWGRYALGKLSHVSLTGLRFSLAVVFAFIFILLTGKVGVVSTVTGREWLYLLAIVFSTGLVALLIYYRGLRHVPARVSTLLELTWPLSALAVDGLFFKTHLTATQWLGAIVLLAVILKISRDFSQRDVLPLGPES